MEGVILVLSTLRRIDARGEVWWIKPIMDMTPALYHRHRFPGEIISHCVALLLRGSGDNFVSSFIQQYFGHFLRDNLYLTDFQRFFPTTRIWEKSFTDNGLGKNVQTSVKKRGDENA
jgi:hypothetical protein